MSVLFTFPGQGAQRAGMLHALPDDPQVRRTLDDTGDVLGQDPLALDEPAALASTCSVQLCLLIAGVAMARALIARGARPAMVAGFSIGAYAAAVVAGALAYPDAVRLVALRGKLMEDAYPHGYGMAAIVGLDRNQLEPFIAQAHSPLTPVYLANLNAPRQLVIAGADAALEVVMQLAIEHGATKAERLAVSVPSHCPLFDAAAEEMATAIQGVTLQRPSIAYLSSNAARTLWEPARIADDLASNMARQVHWSETVRLAWERGARLALEMPPGSVLTKLTAPVLADGLALSCDTIHIDSLLAMLAREPD